jgi:integrase
MKSGRKYWLVQDYRTCKRILRNAKTEDEARSLAKEIANSIAKGKQAVNGLETSDVFALQQSRLTLAPFGLDTLAAVNLVVEALRALGGRGSILEAVRFFIRHGAHEIERKTVKDAVEAYLANQQPKLSGHHYRNVKGILEAFAKNERFTGGVMDVTSAGIEDWLDSFGHSPTTMNNYVKSICAFFNWCVKRRLCPQGFNPASADMIDRRDEDDSEIVIWSVDEAQTVLNRLSVAAFDLVPAFVIGCFLGLRISEIERLTWDMVREAVTTGWLRLQGNMTKTGKARILPVSVNAKAWLLPHLGKTGPVVPESAITETPVHISKATGIAWKANASRHSYGSYRYAVTQNIGQVSKEMGNGSAKCLKHYARPDLTPEQGHAWFGIMPQAMAATIPLPAAG